MNVLLAAALLQVSTVAGNLPAAVDTSTVTRIEWLSGDVAQQDGAVDCQVGLPRAWLCSDRSADDVGVAVIETTTQQIGFVVKNRSGVIASDVAAWGRLVRVVPVAELANISVAALKVERPMLRPNTLVLDVVPIADVRVWPVSSTSFWLAGNDRAAIGFIRVAANDNASHDEPIERVSADAADKVFTVWLQPPVSIDGRVESQSGEPVAGALVDLFALVPNEEPQPTPPSKEVDVMRTATTQTGQAGEFTFDGLETRQYKVVIVDFMHGRTEMWTQGGASVVARLKDPRKATGRVLRQQLPAVGVAVRFIPDATAWRESRDPSAHLTLDSSTSEDGRFVLTLPPSADGTIQFSDKDGAVKRIRLTAGTNSSEIALGDIVLSDLISVDLQTDVPDCVLSAIGPAGANGFSIVRARGSGIFQSLDLPEAGQWLLRAECGGASRRVTPASVEISATGEPSTRAIHIAE